MNINKDNYKNVFDYLEFSSHNYKINKITINNKIDQITIEGQELGKQNIVTTLVLNNVLYFEYPNFNPWGGSGEIISIMGAEDLNNYIDYLKENRYFDFEQEKITLKENNKFSDIDKHFLIWIELISGDFIKFIVTDVEIVKTKIE